MMDSQWEDMLAAARPSVERYIRIKLGNAVDAEDVIQETMLAAMTPRDFSQERLTAWLLGVARHKCIDFYRAKAKSPQSVAPEALPEPRISSRGRDVADAVHETLEQLSHPDRQILALYYLQNRPQSEISQMLGIPLGTVKSRLYGARGRFKEAWPYPPKGTTKGENTMEICRLPVRMPEYTIKRLQQHPFPVRWEELDGWFLIPRAGEKVTWGMYDMPERKLNDICRMEATCPAVIHGQEGVEFSVRWFDGDGQPREEGSHRYWAQLTETEVRMLGELYEKRGAQNLFTFADGETFFTEWGLDFEESWGKPIDIAPRGKITRQGDTVTCSSLELCMDVVDRCRLTLDGKEYDTICIMLVQGDVATEQFLSQKGHTLLWRRFNRDDWALERYKMPWSQKLPDNERITINGELFVHWYDCITDRER